MIVLVMPVLFAVGMNLHWLTLTISEFGTKVLGTIYPGILMSIQESEFSVLGTMSFIKMPSVVPDRTFAFINLLVILAVVILLLLFKKTNRPLAMYVLLCLFIHTINCVYFIFAPNDFPYSIEQFSDLYMKQQIGIWLTFIILFGTVTAFLGKRGFGWKALAFFSTVIYSLVFGSVRYILFLYILQKFSILYMAVMFFVFGPLFDFLYLVAIYSLLINKLISIYDSKEGSGDWKWA